MDKHYQGLRAASVSHATLVSAGRALPAKPTAGPSNAPVPPLSMADKRGAPLYQLTTGPIFDRRRADDIVNQLLAAGLSAAISIQGQGTPEGFRVVSETLLSTVAQRRAAGLADLHPDQELLADGRLKLQFGIFSTEQDATALAEAIRRRGYRVTVEATGGTRFVVTVNPSARAAIDRSMAIIRANGADLSVSVQAAP